MWGLIATLLTIYKILQENTWWPWLFLLSGIIYYFVKYNKYRNTGARHSHESETKSSMKNIRKVDNLVKRKKRLRNSTMDGANNKRVSGTAGNKDIMSSVVDKVIK